MASLFIKNMVCNRCIMVVENELRGLGYNPKSVRLGEAVFADGFSANDRNKIGRHLQKFGFELLDDHRRALIEKVKNGLREKIRQEQIEDHFSLATFVSDLLNKEYSTIGRLFSEVENQTLEHYYILQKIEKVKELLTYAELTLSEIGWKLGYSSVAHLSSQFKQVTGMTPTAFKKQHNPHRIPLDEL